MPETWTGFRNIDEEIDLDEINRRIGADGNENEQD
jgi:hypothetical protein